MVLPAIGEVELASGLTIAASRNTEAGVVRLAIAMRGGFGRDPVGTEGLARFVGAALELAARSPAHDARFGDLGAMPSIEVSRSGLVVAIDVMPSQAAAGATALAAFVLEPEITDVIVMRAREIRRAALVESLAMPSRLAALAMAQAYAPQVGPMAGLGLGTRASLAKIDKAAVLAHLTRARDVRETAFLVAGPCELGRVDEWARAAFAAWPTAPAELPPGAARVARRSGRLIFVPVPGMRQALVSVGGLRPHVTDDDALGHAVAVDMLGTTVGYVMREEKHATYGLGNDVDTEVGAFVISLRVRPDRVRETVGTIEDAVEGVARAPAELWLAAYRARLRAALMTEAQDVRYLVARMSANFLFRIDDGSFGDSLAAIDALTDVDVLGAARRHLDADLLQIVVLADPETVKGELDEGFVEVRPTTLIDGDAAGASTRVAATR